MKPSQLIKSTDMDDAYDKLYQQKQDMQNRLDGVDMAVGLANERIKELEEALHLYIDAGCMEGTHFVLQKNALDNAKRCLAFNA